MQDWQLGGHRIGRRGFLRGFGLVTAGVAGAALLGCGDDDNEPSGGTSGSGTSTAGGTSTGGGANIGDADVMGLWGSEELDSFKAMVAPWEKDTGGKVNFTGTRDLTAILTTRVEGNNAPDIAIPAEVGLFKQFVSEKKLRSLKDLGIDSLVSDKYPEGFKDLGTVDGTMYGFFMKADTKATIWYNPKLFKDKGWEPLDADAKWGDLISLSEKIKDSGMAPWSIGFEAGGDTGWPGTDWIQQIVLNEAGAEVYDAIVDGSMKFTDPKMKDAWQKFGQIALGDKMTAQGGAAGILATNFQDSSYLPFESAPRAAMLYLGGFAGGFIKKQFPNLVAGEDYDFFPWPGGGVTGAANIAYAFNASDTTKSLMKYLAGADAQQIWVERGGFTSVNSDVGKDAYPDDVARKQAAQLSEADLFRFDLDDAIGGALQQAYFTGITQYLQNPNQLDQILQSIESARAA
jgi:alpha-glucoside transport system substrate-binding protein